MDNVATRLFAIVLAGLVLWQLVTGKVLDRGWRPSVDRENNPRMYWFTVLCQSVILIIIVLTGELSWKFPSFENPSALVSASRRTSPSPLQERREQGFELHRAEKLSEAIAVYDGLLQESDKDAELYYWRGVAHWKLQHTDLALQDFRRVIELQPANFDAHRSADRILSRQQRWDEVLEMWDRYIASTPASAEAYFERGGTNYHKGNLAAARADAAKACELGKAEACPWVERLRSKP